jgi:hypothetical protein
MAQTTVAVTGAAATVSIYSSGAYVDISGSSQSVDVATAKVVTGDAYTFDGNYAITTIGKYEPVEVKVNILFTEAATEAFILLNTLFTARTATQAEVGATGSADERRHHRNQDRRLHHRP